MCGLGKTGTFQMEISDYLQQKFGMGPKSYCILREKSYRAWIYSILLADIIATKNSDSCINVAKSKLIIAQMWIH